MFSYVWSNKRNKQKLISEAQTNKNQKPNKVIPLVWLEHCVECVMPTCYNSCSIYEKREDGRCIRFVNGISFLEEQNDKRIDIGFKKWAKLEAKFDSPVKYIDSEKEIKIDYKWSIIANYLNSIITKFGVPKLRIVYEKLFDVYSRKILRGKNNLLPFNTFSCNVFNYQNETIEMNLEITQDLKTSYRNVFKLKKGWNTIDCEISNINSSSKNNKVSIWLNNDIVNYLSFESIYLSFKEISSKQTKIKCVAWDLDNTLWDGVIGDDGSDNVIVNHKALDLIKALDERGILNTIISKNTHEIAWKKIVELGFEEYFLYPAINWGRKSENLKQISKKLNIGLDTFCVIDDSDFERIEIQSSLPQIKVFHPNDINSILNLDMFNVTISDESKNRRKSYLIEAERNKVLKTYGDDYNSFLESCEIEITIIKKFDESTLTRCHELLQRSNQFNLSTKRLSLNELKTRLENENFKLYALSVKDKFGDYGIVGFASLVIKESELSFTDFVMSCRVAQKKIEESFILWLVKENNFIDYVSLLCYKTKRNPPLIESFREMKLTTIDENKELVHFRNHVQDKIFSRLPVHIIK